MTHDSNESDATTVKKMAWTFGAFVALGIFLILLANYIG